MTQLINSRGLKKGHKATKLLPILLALIMFSSLLSMIQQAFGNEKKVAKPVSARSVPTPTPTPDPRLNWDNFADMVIREGDKRGYHGETLARQKALESGFGTSKLARERFNYGGIGAYDADPNNAFGFKSPEDYLNYYFRMIEKEPRYKNAYQNRANPRRYLEELKNAGYASDPDYVWKILNTPVRRGK